MGNKFLNRRGVVVGPSRQSEMATLGFHETIKPDHANKAEPPT